MTTEPTGVRRVLRDNGLSIVLFALFVGSMIGQTWSGWRAYNEQQRQHGEPGVGLAAYLGTGHFGEATFENWESEFLQMAFYVLLTVVLFQKGSSESKLPGGKEEVDADPRAARDNPSAPWPVRRGGWVLVLYEGSLSLTFIAFFLLSFTLHAKLGLAAYSADRLAHQEPAATLGEYVRSSQFWFESFQNWQSEFLSLAAMVVLSIFLRQRGSPESKPVAAPNWQTAE